MARPHRGLEDFLDFTSTPVWRSAILSAALYFACFHGVALMTPKFDLDASAEVINLPQLAHLTAVLLRFAVPFGCIAAGLSRFAGYRRTPAPLAT